MATLSMSDSSEFRPFMPGGEDMVIVRKPSSTDDIAMPPTVPVTDTARLTDWARRTCVPLVSVAAPVCPW